MRNEGRAERFLPIVSACQPLLSRFLEQRLDNRPDPVWSGHLDRASGKDVWNAAAMRCALFIAIALYGWAWIAIFERWGILSPTSTEPSPGG